MLPPLPRLVLVVRNGPLANQRLEIAGEVVLGREGDLELGDDEVSRRHARLRTVGGEVEVEDLGSLNGTFVNGRRIASATRLHAGDLVVLGDTTLAVEGAGETVAAPTPLPPMSAAAGPPLAPFAAFEPPPVRRRRGPASRSLPAAAITFAVVISTAIALVVYFAAR